MKSRFSLILFIFVFLALNQVVSAEFLYSQNTILKLDKLAYNYNDRLLCQNVTPQDLLLANNFDPIIIDFEQGVTISKIIDKDFSLDMDLDANARKQIKPKSNVIYGYKIDYKSSKCVEKVMKPHLKKYKYQEDAIGDEIENIDVDKIVDIKSVAKKQKQDRIAKAKNKPKTERISWFSFFKREKAHTIALEEDKSLLVSKNKKSAAVDKLADNSVFDADSMESAKAKKQLKKQEAKITKENLRLAKPKKIKVAKVKEEKVKQTKVKAEKPVKVAKVVEPKPVKVKEEKIKPAKVKAEKPVKVAKVVEPKPVKVKEEKIKQAKVKAEKPVKVAKVVEPKPVKVKEEKIKQAKVKAEKPVKVAKVVEPKPVKVKEEKIKQAKVKVEKPVKVAKVVEPKPVKIKEEKIKPAKVKAEKPVKIAKVSEPYVNNTIFTNASYNTILGKKQPKKFEQVPAKKQITKVASSNVKLSELPRITYTKTQQQATPITVAKVTPEKVKPVKVAKVVEPKPVKVKEEKPVKVAKVVEPKPVKVKEEKIKQAKVKVEKPVKVAKVVEPKPVKIKEEKIKPAKVKAEKPVKIAKVSEPYVNNTIFTNASYNTILGKKQPKKFEQVPAKKQITKVASSNVKLSELPRITYTKTQQQATPITVAKVTPEKVKPVKVAKVVEPKPVKVKEEKPVKVAKVVEPKQVKVKEEKPVKVAKVVEPKPVKIKEEKIKPTKVAKVVEPKPVKIKEEKPKQAVYKQPKPQPEHIFVNNFNVSQVPYKNQGKQETPVYSSFETIQSRLPITRRPFDTDM